MIQEYHDNIGDMEGAEERDKRRGKIQKLISSMWRSPETVQHYVF